MKKTLLLGAILTAGVASAQMTQTNEPTLGTTNYHLVDSNAVTYDNVTGTNVTWDYSNLAGYQGETRDIEIEDASTTPYSSDFGTADRAITYANQITTYFSSDASERISQGYVFSDQTFGDVKVVYDSGADQELLVDYPFANGDSFSDDFAGTLFFDYNGIPQSPAMNGVANIAIDGSGTLLLPGGTSLTNVIRYKLVDTVYTTVPVLNDVEIVRSQYEYYKYDNVNNPNMPVLTITKIKIQNPGATEPITPEVGLTLSSVAPTQFVGINETEELIFGIFPNPANEVLNIQGDFSGDAEVVIMDGAGRIINSSNVSNNKVDVSNLMSGVYFVKVTAEGKTSTKTFLKK